MAYVSPFVNVQVTLSNYLIYPGWIRASPSRPIDASLLSVTAADKRPNWATAAEGVSLSRDRPLLPPEGLPLIG